MITLIVQLFFLTVIFFICIRYDLGKSFNKSLSRAILIGFMIGILYILLQQHSIEGMNTFGPKMKNGYDTNKLFNSIVEKAYRTKLPMEKKWQDDNNLFSKGK